MGKYSSDFPPQIAIAQSLRRPQTWCHPPESRLGTADTLSRRVAIVYCQSISTAHKSPLGISARGKLLFSACNLELHASLGRRFQWLPGLFPRLRAISLGKFRFAATDLSDDQLQHLHPACKLWNLSLAGRDSSVCHCDFCSAFGVRFHCPAKWAVRAWWPGFSGTDGVSSLRNNAPLVCRPDHA